MARRGGASGNASKSELDSFGLLDRNADGKISRSEFGICRRGRACAQARRTAGHGVGKVGQRTLDVAEQRSFN